MDLQRCWDCDKFHAPMLVCTQTGTAAKSMVSCPLEAPRKVLSSRATEEETASRKKPANPIKSHDAEECSSAPQHTAKGKPMDGQGVAEKLLRIEELAAYLGVPKSWIYEQSRQRKRNGFPVLKLGKYLRFDLEAVRQWAADQAKKA